MSDAGALHKALTEDVLKPVYSAALVALFMGWAAPGGSRRVLYLFGIVLVGTAIVIGYRLREEG